MIELLKPVSRAILKEETPLECFRVNGLVKVLSWENLEGDLVMDTVVINGELDDETLKASLNDGGFGVQEILGGILRIEQQVKIEETGEGYNNTTYEWVVIADGYHIGDTEGVEYNACR